MMIRSMIDDTSRYTPENVRSLNDLIN